MPKREKRSAIAELRCSDSTSENARRDKFSNPITIVGEDNPSKKSHADSDSEESNDDELSEISSLNSERQQPLLKLMKDVESTNALEVCVRECEWGGPG